MSEKPFNFYDLQKARKTIAKDHLNKLFKKNSGIGSKM